MSTMRLPGNQLELLSEALDCIVAVPQPAEAFGLIAGRLMAWLRCGLVVLQVEAGNAGPLLFQEGSSVLIPGLGLTDHNKNVTASANLAEGRLVVTDDLRKTSDFDEDLNLVTAGYRSAVRGSLFAGGREIGRIGVFAAAPHHFHREKVQRIEWMRVPLACLSRHASLLVRGAEGAELSLEDVVAEAMEQSARTQMGALAFGLADEVGNLITELAVQVDLLQGCLAKIPEARPRLEALERLVDKGTSLGVRLESMATLQRPSGEWPTLSSVIDGVCNNLRNYRGGRHLKVDKALGKFAAVKVEPGVVESALTHLLLAIAQQRNSEARVLLRAHPHSTGDSSVVLWIAELGGEPLGWEAGLGAALTTARASIQRAGGSLTRIVLEPGAQALALQIPTRMA